MSLFGVISLLMFPGSANSSGHDDGRPGTCAPGDAMLDAADAHAAVYRFGPHHRPLEESPVYRACLYGRRHQWVLGAIPGYEFLAVGFGPVITAVTLAGTTVAFERESQDRALDWASR